MMGKKKRKIGLKVVSGLLALLLWIYVAEEGNLNTSFQTLDVSLSYYNIPENLDYIGPDTVKVRVWGSVSEEELNLLTVYVDLAGLEVGKYELPVVMNPLPSALLTKVMPDMVSVELVYLLQQEFPVVVELGAGMSGDIEIWDLISIPDTCVLYGDQDTIIQVQRVTATVQSFNANDVSMQKIKLQPRDGNGQVIESGIRIVPEQVNVYVAAGSSLESVNMTVHPVLGEMQSEQLSIKDVYTEPGQVWVVGTKAVINKQNQTVYTKEVDISQLIKNNPSLTIHHLEVDLETPEGIRAYPGKVFVFIELEPMDTEIRP